MNACKFKFQIKKNSNLNSDLFTQADEMLKIKYKQQTNEVIILSFNEHPVLNTS